jgi:hypothetical protein
MPCKLLEYIKPQKQMKATLKYNLPDDDFEFNCAVKSTKMYFALTEIKDEIRSFIKYQELKENQYEIIDKLRDRFHEILSDNEINLDRC